jgi:hypothetical protein
MFDPKAKPEETQNTSRLIDELNERPVGGTHV